MLDFILSSQNMPFAIALTLMLAIAMMEGVATLIGAGLSDLLDSLLPDVDFDVDLDSDMQAPGPLTKLLSWLRVGQVPVLMLVIVFLTAFGLIGLFCQSMSLRILGHLQPAILVSVPALFVAFPVVSVCGGILGRVIPQDESESVSEDSFVGRVAVTTLGRAERGKPAQARLSDQHGQAHYIMVEPDGDHTRFEQGTTILIVSHEGAVFKAIENPSAALTD